MLAHHPDLLPRSKPFAIALEVPIEALRWQVGPTAKEGERTAFWGVPRAPMTLAVSEDGGRTWPYKRNLEVGSGYCMTNNSREQLNREYSYPSIKQGPDGALHIAFTYFRQAIKYVRLAEDWVRG